MVKGRLNLWMAALSITFFFFFAYFVCAEEKIEKDMAPPTPQSPREEDSLEEKAEAVQAREKIAVEPEVIEKTMPSYRLNLKQLIEEAKRNIKKIDEEMKQAEIQKQNKEREERAREHFERGKKLSQEGKPDEARQEWQKVLEMSKNPGMKAYIKEAKKRTRKEELARKKEEQIQVRERARRERESQRQIELEKKETEKQLKELRQG